MTSKRLLYFLACLTLFMLPTGLFGEDETAIPELDEKRQDVINWLEEHVGDELLITPEALLSLIEQVKTLPDDEFQKWYIEMRRVRMALEGEAWQQTRVWLQQYLDSEGVYTAEEIDEFRSEVSKLTPSQILQLLQRIRSKYQQHIAAREADQRNRQLSMNIRNSLVTARQSTNVPAGYRSRGANVQNYFGPSSAGPVRTSYAQRKNSYRRNIGIWPGGHFWGRW